jgi:hypothetical protein
VGIFLLTQTLPKLIYWALLAGSDVFAPSEFISLSYEQKATAVATLIQLAIGAWLTFGARQVSALLFRPAPTQTTGEGQ